MKVPLSVDISYISICHWISVKFCHSYCQICTEYSLGVEDHGFVPWWGHVRNQH